jgi:hypothetical protein
LDGIKDDQQNRGDSAQQIANKSWERFIFDGIFFITDSKTPCYWVLQSTIRVRPRHHFQLTSLRQHSPGTNKATKKLVAANL